MTNHWRLAAFLAALLTPLAALRAAEATVFQTIALTPERLAEVITPPARKRIKPLPPEAGQPPAASLAGKVTFNPIALEPSTSFRRLQVTFRARVIGDHTIEKNPLCGIAPELSNLPEYQVVAKNQDGTAIRTMKFRQALTSGDWYSYRLLAYLPPAAKTLEMTFLTNAAPEIHLAEITFSWHRQDAILHNGDFSLGPHNYSGWAGYERMGALEQDGNGKTVLNTMPNGAFYTERFPLTPGQNYRIIITWSEQDNELRVSPSFYDANGNRIKNYTWKTPAPRKNSEPLRVATNDFKFPEDAVTASIYIYAGIIHKVEVIPLP